MHRGQKTAREVALGGRMWVSGVAQWGCQMLHGRKVGGCWSPKRVAPQESQSQASPPWPLLLSLQNGGITAVLSRKKGSATSGLAETATTQGHPGHEPTDEASHSAYEYRQGRAPWGQSVRSPGLGLRSRVQVRRVRLGARGEYCSRSPGPSACPPPMPGGHFWPWFQNVISQQKEKIVLLSKCS